VKEQNKNKSIVSTIIKSLEDESIELIDFDNLRTVLGDMRKTCDAHEKISAELAFIKGEYRNRIAGMLKAVMTCRHNEGDMQILSDLSGDVKDIDAGELVKLYGRVAARFRDSFPASFRYMTYPDRFGSQKDWSQHKI